MAQSQGRSPRCEGELDAKHTRAYQQPKPTWRKAPPTTGHVTRTLRQLDAICAKPRLHRRLDARLQQTKRDCHKPSSNQTRLGASHASTHYRGLHVPTAVAGRDFTQAKPQALAASEDFAQPERTPGPTLATPDGDVT